MLLLILLLHWHLPSFVQGWHECEVIYDVNAVIPWDFLWKLIPFGVDTSRCFIISSSQPGYVSMNGFAVRATCKHHHRCPILTPFCDPKPGVADVTETLTLSCPDIIPLPDLVLTFERPGDCECQARIPPPVLPECVKVFGWGPPPILLPFLWWCKLLGPAPPPIHCVGCIEVNNGCPLARPNCKPINIVQKIVNFQCPVFLHIRLCLNVIQLLTCPAGSIIKITEAFFGAWEAFGSCPSALLVNSTCKNDTTETIQNLCDGKENCTFNATSEILGDDPCPGVSKHLSLQHFCAPVLTITECEYDNISISCPGNLTINVISATYGRPYPLSACPPGGSGEPNPACSMDVTTNVSAICDGRTSCTFSADPTTLGISDPCNGTFDFLEVKIICNPIILWWGIAVDIVVPAMANLAVPYDEFDCPDPCL